MAPARGMDGNTQVTPEVETLQPTRTPLRVHLRNPRVRLGLAIGLGLLVLLGLFRFLADRAAYVSTSDARIAADMIAVSTDISGKITSQRVSVGDMVKTGDVLYTIDDREAAYTLAEFEAEANRLRAEIAREEARIGLASSKAGSEVAARRAGTQSASASVEAARSNLETAQRDYDRTQGLFDRGLVPQSALDQSRNALDTARQGLLRAEADRDSARAEQRTASIQGEEVRLIELDLGVLRASLQQAEARVDAQRVVLEQHTIRAPIDGVIDELFYDTGEHSLRGFRVALMHDPDAVWVSANIKETDIRKIETGADVRVKADSHPGTKITGTVTKIHNATLGESALMPNPNANGVFTKITQRITVRIDLDDPGLRLRPGTMVTVRIRKQPSKTSA
ncbi:HlyD family secretion protein [Hyphomonas jannaschiana]|uniref:HlyD family secretion protein n=1 Tax=Hyphomonas jannaschiana TaxID=86 RepID=UPI0035C789AC